MINDHTKLDLNKFYYYINDVSVEPNQAWDSLMSRIVRVCYFKVKLERLGVLVGMFNRVSEDGRYERPINLGKDSNNKVMWFERLPEMIKYLDENFSNHEKYMTVIDTMSGEAITLYREGDCWNEDIRDGWIGIHRK